LIPSEAVQGWALEVPVENGEVRQRIVVEGLEARRIIGRVMPSLTPWGAKDDQILQGVKRIEDAGDPDKYLRWLARNPRQIRDYMGKKDVVTRERRKRGTLMDTLGVQAPDACLAVEMAVNEENERIALDRELAALEDAWKEAEEIAGIADNLALPRDVERGLDSLRRTRAENLNHREHRDHRGS
jgi:hypothetical protein